MVELQRRARRVTAVYLFVWLMMYGGLAAAWGQMARQWALLSGGVLGYGLWVLWQHLPENHRQGEPEVLLRLGPGNGLTLMRGLGVGLLAGFLFLPKPAGVLAWLPAVIYTLADIADYLDGYLARISNHATRLGARLDMEFDGLGVLVVSLLAVWYGQLPGWYLLLGAARYLFVAGLWWRGRAGLPIYEMPPSVHRRIFAGFQMGFFSVVLWPIVPPAGATIAGTLFAIPTALGFLRDWLMAIGWLKPDSAVYLRLQRWVFVVATVYVPPLLRITAVPALLALFSTLPSSLSTLFTLWQLPGMWVGLLVGLGWVAGTAVVVGGIGRLFAILLLFPVGFDMMSQGLQWWNGVLVVCAIGVMLLGSGPFALWRPEEQFMVWQAGGRSGQ